MLYWYKAEKDAERGSPPAGGIDCKGSHIERVANSMAEDIEFLIHTGERVLGLRTASEDTFRLWVGAIVTAGGRAPLTKAALGARHADARHASTRAREGHCMRADVWGGGSARSSRAATWRRQARRATSA